MADPAPFAPTHLRCEYLVNPLGIDEPRPRFSWRVNDERRGAIQSAWQILVATDAALLDRDGGDVWDSGKVASDANANVEYAEDAAPLEARRRYFWKVRTWDDGDVPSPWSATAWWEMGILDPDDWSAEWIGRPGTDDREAPAWLRREFTAAGPVRRARAYVTGLGFYELRLNGAQVGDDLFAPGWTDYRRRVMYRTHDVTEMLREGPNAVGAIVAEGWYCGRLGWEGEENRSFFGKPPPRLLLQLEIEYEDGRSERVVTDGSWTCSGGPILSSGLYAGERWDGRQAMPGWDAPGFDAAAWGSVAVFPDNGAERNAQMDPPIRATEELTPVSIVERAPGIFIADMGQNMVGHCRLRARGPAGTKIMLRHAEVLQPDGSLYTRNLRTARATETYFLRGGGEEVLEPRFTYHGFRYVELTGYPGTPTPDILTGVVVHTDCERASTLETSSDMVNTLWRNILWGQRGNMHSVLTDCPQRDERLGWMGDAQVFARTACCNMDMAAMLTKFCRDMTDAQTPEGAFTDVVPFVSPGGALPPKGAPAWMDAGVIVPWVVYLCYGDTRILRRHLDSMLRYVDYITENNPDGIWRNACGANFGDWVPAGAVTDKTQFATLHYFRSAILTAAAADILGREKAREHCAAVAGRVREAFNARYLREGRYEGATQTVNALALGFGVCPHDARPTVAQDLVRDIEERNGHLSTGFGGTQWLLPALSDAGRDDVARCVLLQRDFPSWGYMIEKDATTIWELWNADSQGPGMNSRNHFAYGSVGEWILRYFAGIDTTVEGAGFRRVLIRPRPGGPDGELTSARATYQSPQGTVGVAWRVSATMFELDVQVPANSCARIYVPAAAPASVTEAGRPLEQAEGVRAVGTDDGCVVCDVAAGHYRFAAPAEGGTAS